MNISVVERAGRIPVGVVGMVAGLLLVRSGDGTVPLVLGLLLAAAGLDVLVTGLTGHCPLYAKLGHVPSSLRRRS
ncbi:MAG: YgaP-like transmembrane domain [Solirubrobacterales bacterium]